MKYMYILRHAFVILQMASALAARTGPGQTPAAGQFRQI
jgi:hypothetical protein